MLAVTAQEGFHGEQGWAVLLQQYKRRIVLKGQIQGYSLEEAYAKALAEGIKGKRVGGRPSGKDHRLPAGAQVRLTARLDFRGSRADPKSLARR
jgi:hypothetical protein